MQAATEFPTSFAQERVWVLQRLEPESRAYHFQATLTFDGTLDVTALERSLRDLVRRHAIFRTTFPSIDGRPVQAVAAEGPVHLVVVDLGRHADAETRLARTIHEELGKRFDLERLPS